MHTNLYMAIILGANMLDINFCLFKETPMRAQRVNCPVIRLNNSEFFYCIPPLLQAQTRSADEPMTTFAYCLTCGHRWKVRW